VDVDAVLSIRAETSRDARDEDVYLDLVALFGVARGEAKKAGASS
jgi:hypothetical protein